MFVYHLDRWGAIGQRKRIELLPLCFIDSSISQSNFFDLYRMGISNHGRNYFDFCIGTVLAKSPSDNSVEIDIPSFDSAHNHLKQRFFEYSLELVRRAYFPHHPSRITSMFAVENIHEFHLWPELQLIAQPAIYRINIPDNSPKFDANLLDSGIICCRNQNGNIDYGFNPTNAFDAAYRYWSQEASENPRWEYLVPLPIDIEKLPLTPADIQAIIGTPNAP